MNPLNFFCKASSGSSQNQIAQTSEGAERAVIDRREGRLGDRRQAGSGDFQAQPSGGGEAASDEVLQELKSEAGRGHIETAEGAARALAAEIGGGFGKRTGAAAAKGGESAMQIGEATAAEEAAVAGQDETEVSAEFAWGRRGGLR